MTLVSAAALSPSPPPIRKPPVKRTLAGLVGVIAAGILFTQVPKEESGRTVKVAFHEDGAAQLTAVSGAQYLHTYLDIAGVATYCDGLTHGAKMGQVWTEQQCTDQLEAEMIHHAMTVLSCTPALTGKGMDYARAAAISFDYNTGGWCGSSARKKLAAGDVAGGCAGLLAWDKARVKGVLRPVRGLTMRRHREQEMCLTGLPGYPPATMQARMGRWR